MRSCVSNGRIVDPSLGIDGPGTLWIEGGVVAGLEAAGRVWGNRPDWAGTDGSAAAASAHPEVRVTDAAGCWVTPGLIDLHVHFREPGFTYKEDIESGCRAAARGGFTTVCCMPNTEPVIDCPETVRLVAEKEAALGVRVLPVGALTRGQEGRELADIRGMGAWASEGGGVCALSEDGKSVASAALMLAGMKEAAALGLPVFSHAEDPSLPGTALGEVLIIARDILLARESGCRLHICHVSTAAGVELIRRARVEGLAVTGEAAPHHFALTGADVPDRAEPEKGIWPGNWKMNPPLRTEADRQALLTALKDGTLEAIATDHAPHSREEKEAAFGEAANGIVGLETAFAVSYTTLVEGGLLTPLQLIERMSLGPARILGIRAGSLAPGMPADLAVLDVESSYVVRPEEFLSKGRNTPFAGRQVRGRSRRTLAAGQTIFSR
ncbi:MAG: dihydroorotase [Bacillota bacterium]|nr:dihydroorotase [Bacillota bacterium]